MSKIFLRLNGESLIYEDYQSMFQDLSKEKDATVKKVDDGKITIEISSLLSLILAFLHKQTSIN